MNLKRRQFIRSAAMLIGGLTISKARAAFLPPALRVRREVSSAAAQHDLTLYKKAVTVMKARPATDPTSWEAQAHIHNDFCPHGNWFFLPWHRAYLRQFELICRQACGDDSFNLPYWDWTKNPSLPASFWGTGNPLLDTTRQCRPSDKIAAEFTGITVMNDIYKLDSFEDFGSYRAAVQRPDDSVQGQLEGTPHNSVHRFVLGNMGNFLSPRDPIFWLHHANVDRVWATWNDRNHANPSDAAWTDYGFVRNFYQPNGAVIANLKCGDMSDQRALGYVYDTQQTTIALAHLALTNFKLMAESRVTALTAHVELSSLVPNAFAVKGINKINALAEPAVPHNASVPHNRKREVKAFIRDIAPPDQEDFFVRVFLDCPYLSKDTPITDPHYVGSFTFFASHHVMSAGSVAMDMSKHRISFALDITDNLKRLKDVNKADTDQVKLQLLLIPFKVGGQAKLVIPKVDIVVAEKTS